jgi:hypothetical protein
LDAVEASSPEDLRTSKGLDIVRCSLLNVTNCVEKDGDGESFETTEDIGHLSNGWFDNS